MLQYAPPCRTVNSSFAVRFVWTLLMGGAAMQCSIERDRVENGGKYVCARRVMLCKLRWKICQTFPALSGSRIKCWISDDALGIDLGQNTLRTPHTHTHVEFKCVHERKTNSVERNRRPYGKQIQADAFEWGELTESVLVSKRVPRVCLCIFFVLLFFHGPAHGVPTRMRNWANRYRGKARNATVIAFHFEPKQPCIRNEILSLNIAVAIVFVRSVSKLNVTIVLCTAFGRQIVVVAVVVVVDSSVPVYIHIRPISISPDILFVAFVDLRVRLHAPVFAALNSQALVQSIRRRNVMVKWIWNSIENDNSMQPNSACTSTCGKWFGYRSRIYKIKRLRETEGK